MLIALPLKGLAAIGVVLCCPPGVVAAMPAGDGGTHGAHAGHDAQASAEALHAGHASSGDAHDHGDAEPGAKLVKPLLCCGGAAMLMQTEAPALVPHGAADLQMHTGKPYLSADSAGSDKPPRS